MKRRHHPDETAQGIWNEYLKCNVIRIIEAGRTVTFFIRAYDNPCELGSHALAVRLVPDCNRIAFFNGSKECGAYIMKDDGWDMEIPWNVGVDSQCMSTNLLT